MKLEQTEQHPMDLSEKPVRRSRLFAGRLIENLFVGLIVGWAAWILAGGAIPASEARVRALALTAAGLGFDLIAWEITAIQDKVGAQILQPARELSEAEATQMVRDYMARAVEIGHLERRFELLESERGGALSAEMGQIHADLSALRLLQESTRPVVEQILEQQITWALREAGVGISGFILPPVMFTFTEPPRKMIVSPREEISIAYTRMIQPGLAIRQLELIEANIDEYPGHVGYVSNIGGLGAYPSMVVDRSSLRWALSTIAHEWAHNYLVFFPLGLFYFGSGDLNIMNETVADIVGEEAGLLAMRRFYPDLIPPEVMEVLEEESPPIIVPEVEEEAFDFRDEMRVTRLEVDRLLALGAIEEAEAYMEEQRQLFVAHGYAIRVLNQAYFAFHGSYGTSPASTSPIGPKLMELRAQTPDLPTFLSTVRWFTSAADLDDALAEWQNQ